MKSEMNDPIHPMAAVLAVIAFRLGKKINAPSAEGKLLGEQFARFADAELQKRKALFPDHVERCATCAFRKGTVANQCGATLLAALDCIRGDDEFMCHEREDYQCVGYAVLKSVPSDGKPK